MNAENSERNSMNVGHDVLQDAKKKKMHLFDTEFFKLVLYENHGNYYLT